MYMHTIVSRSVKREEWHTQHSMQKKEDLSSYTTEDYDYVKMGNNGVCKIVGIGNVLLLTSTGCRMLLKDLCHVLDIRLNMILFRRLDDEGYCGSFQNDIWKIFYKGNLIVAHVPKQNTLYVMQAQLCWNEVNVAADTSGGL